MENFVIENHMIKGVKDDFDNSHNIGKILLDTLNEKPDHVAQVNKYTWRYLFYLRNFLF